MSLQFSIVVPTYNRPEQVRTCLRALAALDYPRQRYEVILVDDGGVAPLESPAPEVARKVELRIVRQSNAGPAAARNKGASAARGRYLAFTDDDCCPEPGWLKILEAHLGRDPDAMVGGPTTNLLTEDICATASQAILDMAYQFFNSPARGARFLASNNMALATASFADMGGFDTCYHWPGAEDRDLCDRWVHQGGGTLFVPEARVGHGHPMTLAGYCKQHFAYGRGAWLYHRQRALRGSGQMTQDLRFHLELHRLLGRALQGVEAGRYVAVVALLGLWQAANASGFIYQMMRDL